MMMFNFRIITLITLMQIAKTNDNCIKVWNVYFSFPYAACYCHQFFPNIYNESNGWDKIARGIRLLYDADLDYTPQHETFDPDEDTVIKQADTVLIGYPLMYQLATSTLRNNLYKYGNMTREDGPGMTWAMHAIGHIDIGEVPSDEMFYRSYDPYIRRPFYTWQEVVEPFVGVGNFITGAGGFLQLIFNGYGGIRLYSDHMAISHTLLPPSTTKLTINGFKYLKGEFSLEQTETSLRLTVKRFGNVLIRIDGQPPASQTQTIYDLSKSQSIEFWPSSSDIFAKCTMAPNIINIPTDFVEPTPEPPTSQPPTTTEPPTERPTSEPSKSSSTFKISSFLIAANICVLYFFLR